MDNRAGAFKGGESGAAFMPGQPEKSLLLKAIRYVDPELRMPPRGKLADAHVADFARWIEMGAPWPEDKGLKTLVKKDFDLKERSKHWSLQPLTSPPPPQVKDAGWIRSPIDKFILAKLEEKGIPPAPAADKRAQLRRVTFDLTGLPPTPSEIDAFLKDDSADAFAKVVDRLLASPHYGERWARHWLDLVRYAETQGHEFDFDITDAWRYRDYVIRALNDDVPFDKFVIEHIAGDLLPEPRRHSKDKSNESILGTGFWFLGEAKHSPVDVRGDQADRIDNQIDVFGKTFLGMTIACARCHDHKFDAISTKDYYALAGFLQSSRQDRAFLDDSTPRREALRKHQSLLEEAFELARQETILFLKREKNWVSEALTAMLGGKSKPEEFSAQKIRLEKRLKTQEADHASALAGAVVFAGPRDFDRWFATGEAFAETTTNPVLLDFTSQVTAAQILPDQRGRSDRLSAALQGTLRSPTFVISKNKIHYRAKGKDVRINLILDGLQLIREPIYGGLTFTVKSIPLPHGRGSLGVNGALTGRDFEYSWHTQDVSMWHGHRAYIEVLDDGPGHVTLDRVVFSDGGPPPEAPNALLAKLVGDRKLDTVERLEMALGQLANELVAQWETGKIQETPDAQERIDLLNQLLLARNKERADARPSNPTDNLANNKDWRYIKERYSKLPPLPAIQARALAMADGSAVDEHVFIRGNHKKPGELVPRRFLEVFGGAARFAPAAKELDGSGRLDLARTLVDPDKTPILPRVIVNRLWKHHFGEGIGRTPDDFGVLGQPPTHPELLDYLATEFVKNGWSMKKMHRLLLLSSAYQMASVATPQADEADPDNKLLHRMPVRRLEAEEIRDAVLAVSGRLDKSMHGPSVPPHLSAFMVGRGRPAASGPLDGDGRRSIYLAVRRNFINPLFLAFDYPTPFSTMGKRSVSNVPAQALVMMNNPFIQQQAELWAKRVLAEPQLTPRERLEKMYVAAYARPPSHEEVDDALAFLGGRTDVAAWAEFAHVLFNVKEFIFVP